MKNHTRIMAMIALVSLLLMILSGCSSEQKDTVAETESVLTAVPVIASEPEGTPETAEETRRQDGERFEDVIMLEGMEETVRYEHVRNDKIGIEMDYDYESFERRSESDRERFVSRYDNPADPQDYLEVTYRAESADAAAAAVSEVLSKEYAIISAPYTLDHAGSCIRIDASATKDNQTPDLLQMVYIIPAGDGCIVGTSHYTFESAEGFGKRFSNIMNSLVIIGRNK